MILNLYGSVYKSVCFRLYATVKWLHDESVTVSYVFFNKQGS